MFNILSNNSSFLLIVYHVLWQIILKYYRVFLVILTNIYFRYWTLGPYRIIVKQCLGAEWFLYVSLKSIITKLSSVITSINLAWIT